ncbi:MAG: hypothetical protein ABFD69_09860 [Candidatus Sumerlaeia bacterium]
MKQRWPAIGEHADHPMGPWFLERRAERPWRRRYRARYQMSIFWLIPLAFIFSIFAPIVFLIIFLLRRTYNRGAKDLAQPASFFVGRRRANLHELWLSGMSAPEMAAVEIALALSDPWRKSMWWPSLFVWNLIPIGVLSMCGYISYRMEETIPPLGWACILTGAAFWFILFFALNNPNRTAKIAMKDFLDDVDERCRGKIKKILFGCQRAALGCIFVNIMMAAVVNIFMLEHGFEYSMLVLFGSGILLIPWYVIRHQPRMVENFFKEHSVKVQEQFATIIRAESEKDMARK